MINKIIKKAGKNNNINILCFSGLSILFVLMLWFWFELKRIGTSDEQEQFDVGLRP